MDQVIPQMCPGGYTCIVDEDDTVPSCLCNSNTTPENNTCLGKFHLGIIIICSD